MVNSILDSNLRGIGAPGAIISAAKNGVKITESQGYITSLLIEILKLTPESKKLYFIILYRFFTFFLHYEHPKGTKKLNET